MDNNWRNWFADTIYRRGVQYYKNGHVREMHKITGGYEAIIAGHYLYRVEIITENDMVKDTHCNCQYAYGGGKCKHQVAALLEYKDMLSRQIALEAENAELEKINLSLRDKWVGSDGEDDYSYIDLDGIEKKLFEKERDKKIALQLLEKDFVKFSHMTAGRANMLDERTIHVYGMARESDTDKYDKSVGFVITENNISGFFCGCKSCKHSDYYWYNKPCKHARALFYAAYKELRNQRLIDFTDENTINLFKSIHNSRARKIAAKSVETFNERLTLQPRLKNDYGTLELSFKVGASRLFVIKNLSEFHRNVKNGASQTFGKTTVLPLNRDYFDETSCEYLDYIGESISRIEEGIRFSYSEGYFDRRYGRSEDHIRQSIPLSGRGLDDFFNSFKNRGIDYEDFEKKKSVIHFKEKKPKLSMTITPFLTGKGKKKKFSGVKAEIILPQLFHGEAYGYYIDGDNLCRIPQDVYKKMIPLIEDRYMGSVHMDIGRNYLSDFYHSILPELADFVTVKETDKEVISKYLSSDVEFCFYLDAENGNVTCKAIAEYGDNEYNVIDCKGLNTNTSGILGQERIFSKENEVLGSVMQFLPEIDTDRCMFHCDRDEDRIYDFVTLGVEELAKLGEIKVTDSFQHVNVFKKANLSVGVSLSKGMLDLEVSSDEISKDELLEILASYRAKKRYHRLRDNSYINLNDEALATLDDMLKTLQISEKDFLKGNMHVPVYRTLYLDKLLEENEEIYEDRDSRFKNLVKGFKTIKDADFKAPKNLSKILRNYQKTGFKWISTLEKYGFGGILCDDMGLGKTLQTISFLYKHYTDKSIGEKLPSLVVCPASLVYNWADEFAKFAPDMNVVTVAGGAAERTRTISDADKYDVLITSYDLMKRDVAQYEEKEFYYEVIDEAQYIKNHTTAAAKAVKVINSKRRLALTGTPIENRLSELWSIFDFLMPGFLYKYEQFKRQFETPIVKYEDKDASDRLKKMVAPFLLRRLKENVLKELPDKLEKRQTVVMESAQQTLYNAQVQHLKTMIESAKRDKSFNEAKMKILAEMTRLRQICCDPSLYVENYEGESAKRQACLELVERAIEAGHRILIFSQFTTMLDLLKKDLGKAGIDYFEITGATKKEDRIELVNRFNDGENSAFLISLKAGGTGLNLVGADMVIHYDPWWNLAAQNQATDRAHRIGQKKTVTVYKLIAKGTIEEKIVELQNSKSDLAEEILSGETNIISKMTESDFMELLG